MHGMKVKNPFFIKGYHGPEYFCDRVEETKKILAAIENGRDVTLMAPRRIDKDSFAYLYDRFKGVTWCLQVVLNRIWERESGFDAREAVDEVVSQLIDEGEVTYADLLMSQTLSAQAVLKAIAAEGLVKEISAKALIDKYRLPVGSTIRSLIRDLVNRNLVYKSAAGYSIYDQLFAEWLRRIRV